ncbi:hypothetical protein N2152v2_010915 [Parachlorella kessleri]
MQCGDSLVVHLPPHIELLIQKFKVALLAFEQLQRRKVDCEAARRAYATVCAQHPTFARFTDHITLELDFKDGDLTDDAWEWLSKRELRGLGLQQQGLARLLRALPAPPFLQLASLSVSVTGGDDHLNRALRQLDSLRHLEVTLSGPGVTFPKLPRRLESLAVHCSNAASLHSLATLCKAARVTVTAREDVVWNTDMVAGLRGVGMPAALLEVANGRYSGNLAAFHGLRLLIPTGFNRMFGTMSLPEAITSAGTLNCFAAAVAAQLAPLPPFELTLQAKQSMRFQDLSGPLPGAALNFSPALPNSRVVWEALWEGAAGLAGLQLSCSLENVGTHAGGGIRATITKVSPAVEWPLTTVQPQQQMQSGQQPAAGQGTAPASSANTGGRRTATRGRRRNASKRAATEGSGLFRMVKELAKAAAFVGLGLLLRQRLAKHASSEVWLGLH